MSRKAASQELEALLIACIEGSCDEAQSRHLDALLSEDPTVLASYVETMSMHAMLEWRYSDQPAQCGKQPCEREPLLSDAEQTSAAQSAAVFGGFPQNAIDFFSQGMPLAYVVAAAIMGIAIWIGSLIPVSHFVPVEEDHSGRSTLAGRVPPSFVGRITGMVGCRWVDDATAAADHAHVSLGRRYALASGLLEITYSTGAKVILEGPCTYEVDNAAGGSLALGRLTAKVDKKGSEFRAQGLGSAASEAGSHGMERGSDASSFDPHPLFAVRTPTATITDLGTEFAVEVDPRGQTVSHVFRGSVRVQPLMSANNVLDAGQVLRENESAQIEAAGVNSQVVVCSLPNASRFVRELPKPIVKQLDLADVLAGGNGFSGKRGRGIDPTSGNVVDALRREIDPGGDLPLEGDGRYHRAVDRPFIDGVFVPEGGKSGAIVDSSGHIFAGFEGTSSTTWQHIWAGGAMNDPAYPAVIGEIDYAAPEHGLIFLHAAAAITFDLNAIRQAHVDGSIRLFRAVAANTVHGLFKGSESRVDIWVLVDGQSRFQRRQVAGDSGEFPVLVPIGDKDRYMTLAATDGGDGISADWVVFGAPHLEIVATESTETPEGTEH